MSSLAEFVNRSVCSEYGARWPSCSRPTHEHPPWLSGFGALQSGQARALSQESQVA